MSFVQVNWQDDAEVTSEKLQQMATNEQWNNYFMISGQITFAVGNNGAPSGRAIGIQKASRMEGIYIPFDSLTPTPAGWKVRINYPKVNWIDPPIINVTIANGSADPLFGVLVRDGDSGPSAYAEFMVYSYRGLNQRIRGALNVTLLGRTS
jgi:hypothetical protein